MEIQNLPNELQNKIFYFTAEHPCAKMIKDEKDKQRSMMIETVDEDTANKHFSKVYFLDYYFEKLLRKVKNKKKRRNDYVMNVIEWKKMIKM